MANFSFNVITILHIYIEEKVALLDSKMTTVHRETFSKTAHSFVKAEI